MSARLHHHRLGDAESVIGSLHSRVVEQRDLHGGVGAKWRAQQPRHLAPHERSIRAGADPHHVFIQRSTRDLRDAVMPPSGEKLLQSESRSALAMASAHPNL